LPHRPDQEGEVVDRSRASLALGVFLGLACGASLSALAVRAQDELAKKPEEKPLGRAPNDHSAPLAPVKAGDGLTAHPGSPSYVRPEGPPAIVNDWKQPYPQYQPIDDSNMIDTPNVKPNDPNPKNIFKIGGHDKSSFFFSLAPNKPFTTTYTRKS